MKVNFQVYVASFLEELNDASIKVLKLVADAPERASNRLQKQHGGYYSCDLCTANPENIAIPGKKGSECQIYCCDTKAIKKTH